MSAEDFMRAMVKAENEEGEREAAPDEQPAFYHPIDYVIRTWLEHRMHHTYPEAGGYNDQDSHLMDDWHTLSMYYLRAQKGVYSDIVITDNDLPFAALGRD